MTRQEVVKLAREGLRGVEIANRLNIAKATVSVHLKRHALETGETFAKTSLSPKIQALIDSGMSCRESADELGISKMTVTNAIKRGEVTRPKRTGEKSLDEYWPEWVGRAATPHFRRTMKTKMVEAGRCEMKCLICNLVEWRGLPAPLELDHIDGDPTNNNIGNLRILCLHCHTQTPTFGWRNVKARDRK